MRKIMNGAIYLATAGATVSILMTVFYAGTRYKEHYPPKTKPVYPYYTLTPEGEKEVQGQILAEVARLHNQ